MRLLLTIFWRGIRPYRRYLFILVPVALLLGALWVIEPLYGRYAIDEVLAIKEGKDVGIGPLVAGWFGIWILANVIGGISFYYRWKVQELLLTQIRQQYYEHILQLDIAHHVKAKGGELMKKIDNAADATVDMTRQILMELPISFLTSIVFYVVGFFVSWQLTLLALALIPPYVLLITLSVRWTRTYSEKVNDYYVRAVGRGYDAITNIFTVKSGAAEERELGRMQTLHNQAIEQSIKANAVWAILEGVNYFMLLRIALMGAGIYLYIQDELTLGSLFFFQFSFFRMIVPLEMLGNMMPRWNDKIEKMRLAEAIYNQPVTVKSKPDAKKLPDLKGEFRFEDVSLSYGHVDALHGLNLHVKPGEHIALVGHSGAGKSTMAMLINRFYDVSDGRITVDGVDMRDLDVAWWRSQVGLVLQENITFNDSILENIRYSRPTATREEVIEAAKRASAHEFIEKLPQAYDTMVGERGIRLSGGERQRVAIARAILKQPKIVVLDEATSALDSITERAVQDGIKALIKGRTSFIIAHRLSTVRSVDRIALLEGGKIVAVAPHEELLKVAPLYAEMVSLQHAGMLAEDDEEKTDA
jgi:ABC-type multidrug transport system fused ATPase/permease subunit